MTTLRFINAAELPKTRIGAIGKDAVAIQPNGQIRFSSTLGKKLEGVEAVAAAWADTKARVFAFMPVKDVQAWFKQMVKAGNLKKEDKPEEFLFHLKRGSDGDIPPYFAGGGLLKTHLGDYDYKASGNQSFDAEVDENGLITIKVPKGKLTPPPKRERERKEKAEKAETPAKGKAVAAGAEEDDTELEDVED